MPKYYDESDAMLWVQPDGVNTVCEAMECHDLADVPIPTGDVGRSWCVDPATGRFISGARKQGPPGAPTTTITAHVGQNRDWLEHVMSCPTTFYVHKAPCGDRRLFLNYERSWTLRYAITTQRTLTGLATLMSLTGPPGDSTQALALDIDVVKDTLPLVLTRLTTTETRGATDVSFCNPVLCAGYCGPAKGACLEGVVTYKGAALAIANVEYTLDGGATWTSVVGPFLAAEDISSVVCFPVGDGTTTRWIVARGTTSGLLAELSWTDDLGATWNDVLIGVAAEFVQWSGGLFALDHRHIWCGLDSGDIYFSEDGGLTWTQQYNGTNGVNAIRFVDTNLGIAACDAQEVLFTRDGGAHWNALAGPGAGNLLCCDIFDARRAWVGDDAGHLFYTNVLDENMVAGDWVERLLDTPTGAVSQDRINDLMFVRESGSQTDDHCGFLVTAWTGAASAKHGAVYRTFNGGYDWEIWYTVALATDTHPGLNAVWACGQNLAYAVGDPTTVPATAMLVTVNGALP